MKKRRTPRTIRIPVTSSLRDEFAMVLYTSLLSLERAPSAEVFDNLAGIFNVIQLALEHDSRHSHEARLITGGAAALNQAMHRIINGTPAADHEITPIRVGVETIDTLLGRLDVSVLHAAMLRLRVLRTAGQECAT